MKSGFKFFLPFFLIILLCASCAENPTYARENGLLHFFDKSEVTIAITDSGLGGLSILADAVERSQNWKSFKKIDFIYFNALFSNHGGYNTLGSHQEKVSIFDSALKSLENSIEPDLILIGCNTLSVIYENTIFSKRAKTPVRGIIDAGVNLAAQALRIYPDSKIILFATQTTVAQNTHKDRLQIKGFLPERIVYQACPELAKHIEVNYKGDETDMLIFAYVDEALKKIKNGNTNLIVSFNCTHYGYALDLWKNAFSSLGVDPVAYLNPNPRMNDFLFCPEHRDRFSETKTSARIISMVDIGREKIDSLSSYFLPRSPQTAEALKNYEWKEDLFEWKNFIKKQESGQSR